MSVEQSEFFNDKGGVSFDTWSTDQLRDEVKGLFKNYPDTSSATRQELIEILEGNRHISNLTVEKPVGIIKPEHEIEETEKPTKKKPWWQSGQYE
jgi:hypothetical protein